MYKKIIVVLGTRPEDMGSEPFEFTSDLTRGSAPTLICGKIMDEEFVYLAKYVNFSKESGLIKQCGEI